MRRVLEPLAFLSLATAVHAGVFVGFGGGTGAGAGQEGASPLTLAAASPAAEAAVRRWTRVPEVADLAPEAVAPEMVAPEALAAPLDAPPILAAPADLAPPRGEAAPRVETATTPPPAPPPPSVRPRPRPERQAQPSARAATEPAPAQRAAGTGARQGAGSGGASASAGPSAGQLRQLEAEWGAAILARIARQQRYPRGAEGSGTVRVVITVGRDGRLAQVALAASSGNAALDRAALDAVRRAERFPAAPQGLAQAAYRFAVPMTFRAQ